MAGDDYGGGGGGNDWFLGETEKPWWCCVGNEHSDCPCSCDPFISAPGALSHKLSSCCSQQTANTVLAWQTIITIISTET